MARKTCRTEHAEQVDVIKWSKDHLEEHPCLRWLYSVPNGIAQFSVSGGRKTVNYKAIQYFKSEGLNSGVADLCLPFPRDCYHGLYIEMKKEFGGTVSDDQQEFMDYAKREGYCVVLAEGARAAIDALAWYLALPAFSAGISILHPA